MHSSKCVSCSFWRACETAKPVFFWSSWLQEDSTTFLWDLVFLLIFYLDHPLAKNSHHPVTQDNSEFMMPFSDHTGKEIRTRLSSATELPCGFQAPCAFQACTHSIILLPEARIRENGNTPSTSGRGRSYILHLLVLSCSTSSSSACVQMHMLHFLWLLLQATGSVYSSTRS